MSRLEFTKKTKLAAWERAGGCCEICSMKIQYGAQYDHILPAGLGGGNELDNCQVACTKCHKIKTHGHDIPKIQKAKRNREKEMGVTKPKKKIQSRGFGQCESNAKQTSVRF